MRAGGGMRQVLRGDLALHGRLLTPQGERPGIVLTAAGRIVAVVPPGTPVMAHQHISAGAGWVAPGYVDLQLNGGLGHDFGATPAAIATVARWLPCTGVTAFLPTLITAPLEQIEAALRLIPRQAAAGDGAARILGAHLEGPYLNPAYRGAHTAAWLRPVALEELARLCAAGPVRLVTLAPELDGALAAIAWLRQRGGVVSLGHSGASYEQACAAIEAGASLGTHLFNAMTPLRHRAPGLPGALLMADGIRASLIADGVHVHPAMLALAYRLRGASGLVLVTDAMAALGMTDGDYRLSGQLVQVRAGVARLTDGTLAGSVLPMDKAVRTMVQTTGCTVAEAVSMASQAPADVLGLGELGRIEPGAAADLIVLDEQLRVRQTLVAGQIVWEADAAGEQ